MIKASELRIGNDVLLNGEVYEITSATDLDWLGFEPIPLTEEWLLNFGFEKTIKNMTLIDYVDFRIGTCVATIIESGIEIEFCGIDIEERTYIREINFVNELQNLYYFMTGQELEVKNES